MANTSINSDNWGFRIKDYRERLNMSQADLAKRSGLTQSHISRIEAGDYQVMTPDVESKLAKGFYISIDSLRNIVYATSTIRKERPEEILEKLKLATPQSIPVYDEFPYHAGKQGVEAMQYVFRERTKDASENIEGYIVHGTCLTPIIQDKDIIIVDRDRAIDNGDIIACLINEELHIVRIRKVADELWLENNNGKYKFQDCQFAAPVIEVIRRLKS